MASIFVAIVNYRTADLTIACLASLAGQVHALRGGKVIVADNDSRDGSAMRLDDAVRARGWSDWVTVLPLPRNGGFSYGNNACIKHIEELAGDMAFVVLLNPDTVASPGLIDGFRSFMDAHPRAGIVGARIANPDGGIEPSAHRMPTPFGELIESARLGLLSRQFPDRLISPEPQSAAHTCDWVSGACMMVRAEVFRTSGPLDEGFFLYFEEVDFCRRAIAAGWLVWYLPEVSVVHMEGASTGIQDCRRRRPAYWYASRRRFFAKAYGVPMLLWADLMHLIGRCTYLLRKLLHIGVATRDDLSPRGFLWDMLSGDVRAVLRGELRGVHSQ